MARLSTDYSPVEHFERLHVKPRPGRTLIVGSFVTKGKADRRALYSEVVGLDMRDGPGVDLVANLEFPQRDLGQFDHVECRSVLEHSRRPWLLAANLLDLIVSGGTLHLAVPFSWGLHAYPSDYWRMTTEAVLELFPGVEWSALCYVSDRLHNGKKTPRKLIDGHVWIERTEVLGFGVKR